MAVSALNPFVCYLGIDGQPLDGGYLNFGLANQDPVTRPVDIFWDAALSVPASQPVRTLGGFASNNGARANVYTAGDFSIRVADRNNVQQLTAPTNGFRAGSTGGWTLADGEIGLAESGSSIDIRDGSGLALGDGSGAGLVITTDPSARWTGGLIPIVDGEVLGSTTRRWDAFLETVDVEVLVADSIAVSGLLYSANSAQPTTNTQLIAANQKSAILANGQILFTAGTPALAGQKNCASIADVGAGASEITLTVAIDDTAQVFVTGMAADEGWIRGRVKAGSNGLIISVASFDGSGTPLDVDCSFLVVGAPRTLVPAP
jgi:hypothetical protein